MGRLFTSVKHGRETHAALGDNGPAEPACPVLHLAPKHPCFGMQPWLAIAFFLQGNCGPFSRKFLDAQIPSQVR